MCSAMKRNAHEFSNVTKMSLFDTRWISLVESLKKVLENDKLIIEAEGRLVVIPWSSVKYVEASAVVASALPFGAIKGARISQ